MYRLIPGPTAVWLAVILPFLELGVAILLLSKIPGRWSLLMACMLLSMFVGAQGSAWARGLDIDCGCFGGLVRRQIGLESLTFVGLMFLLAVIAAYCSKSTLSGTSKA